MYALIDCNNFYASCERLFRPDLHNKPIVTLSNNDGCVIARSNEAKALGIKMGEPYFKIKALCKQHHVHVFSSNYTLYGDLSQRVMRTIEETWPEVEIYSIDEAFIDLTTLPVTQHDFFCENLQKKIFKHTGIPTSIGIGPSKTLAKLANHIAKKELQTPVFNISNKQEWLSRIAIGDVWGIGRQWGKKLNNQNLFTAADLAACNAHVIKKQFNVVLMRTTLELQGMPCLTLEEIQPKKSIMSSKSFGEMQTSFTALSQAISSHCARAHEKMRNARLAVKVVSVFVRTNVFREDLAQYANSIHVQLIHATDDLRLITNVAKRALRKLYRQGFHYKKVGVCFEELTPKDHQQGDLFHQPDETILEHKDRLMAVMEAINQKHGRQTIRLGAEGFSKTWAMRCEKRSPCYTTRWSELPAVNTTFSLAKNR